MAIASSEGASVDSAVATPVKVVMYITGFGKFEGVAINPTGVMVSQLVEYLRLNTNMTRPPMSSLHIANTKVMEVCTPAVDAGVADIETDIRARYSNSERYVLLHFGVACSAETFQIERQAFNTADFRVVDTSGQQLRGKAIDPAVAIDTRLQTRLPVRFLAEAYNSELSEQCCAAESDDPGRYLCNWCYYRSLQCTERLQRELAGGSPVDNARAQFYSLFVHVPDFATANLDEQLFFAATLIRNITAAIVDPVSPAWASKTSYSATAVLSESVRAAKSGDVTSRNAATATPLPAVPTTNEDVISMVLAQLLSLGIPEDSAMLVVSSLPKNEFNEQKLLQMATERLFETATPAPVTHAPSREHKMVVVVRSDLEMGKGKVAAQSCHAALKAVKKLNNTPAGRAVVDTWQAHGEPIVVVRADDKVHLESLIAAAKGSELPVVSVHDAGRTQVDPGTMTVIAIGPAEVHRIDAITRSLKLL